MMFPNFRSRHAFTLVELLAVIAIIALMLALGGSAFSGSFMAHRLSVAADSLAGNLDTARLLAASKNRIVEFHIITPQDQEGTYFQIQIRNESGSGSVPYSSYLHLPVGIRLLTDATHGGILTLPTQAISTGRFSGATYTGIQFHPNGRVKELIQPSAGATPEEAAVFTVTPNNNFLTLAPGGPTESNPGLPANWISIRVDLKAGAVTQFQP